MDHFRAGDVRRHEIGRELDAIEIQRQGIGQGANHQRLGQSGHSDQQGVSAREERDQQLLDHVVLSDDDLTQFGGNALRRRVQLAHHLHIVLVIHARSLLECGLQV